ncbi:MAG: hypothetical protein H6898_14645 [Rhodobacter sp.]|nr:hypothetical protein [Paracoccaceae bacterium]MCC0077796.1 hypothetical protein [Rhodobacter sp.]
MKLSLALLATLTLIPVATATQAAGRYDNSSPYLIERIHGGQAPRPIAMGDGSVRGLRR